MTSRQPPTEPGCDSYCCNHGCNQGRNCPARQACQLPEQEPDPSENLKQLSQAMQGVSISAGLVMAALVIAHLLVRWFSVA